MKIGSVAGRKRWSAWLVMDNVARHSKHEIIHGIPKSSDAVDLVYWRWGMPATQKLRRVRDLHEAGVKQILGISGYGTLDAIHRVGDSWPTWMMENFSAITTTNLVLKGIAERTKPSLPVYHLPSGVDSEMFSPKPFPETFCIGWAGNPKNPWKRMGRFRRLPFPQKTAGPKTEGGKRRYEDMPDFYAGVSVFVLTSRREGSPLTAKEAAASGRPVVGTAVGDLVEWVPPEYLVEDYRDLTPIIERFRDDRALLVEEGRRFRELVLPYDYRRLVGDYDRMFDEVMEL